MWASVLAYHHIRVKTFNNTLTFPFWHTNIPSLANQHVHYERNLNGNKWMTLEKLQLLHTDSQAKCPSLCRKKVVKCPFGCPSSGQNAVTCPMTFCTLVPHRVQVFTVFIWQVCTAIIIFLEPDYIKTRRTEPEVIELFIGELCHDGWELLTAHTHRSKTSPC